MQAYPLRPSLVPFACSQGVLWPQNRLWLPKSLMALTSLRRGGLNWSPFLIFHTPSLANPQISRSCGS